MIKILKMTVLLIIFMLLLFFSLFYFDFLNTHFDKVEDAISYRSTKISEVIPKEKLKVMTWNIKFGAARIDFFFDCHDDKTGFSKKEAEKNLLNLAKKIKEIDPDILFLQEVDINSYRSGNTNQLKFILENTNLNYGVYASQWKVDNLPKHNIKKINSGNAILSKYPLKNGKRYALPLIKDQDFITQYFYLKRNILKAEINFKNDKLILLNTHISAFSKDNTKRKQIKHFKEMIDSYKNKAVIAGGDLNLIPSTSKKIEEFSDIVCKENFVYKSFKLELNILDILYKSYTPAISLKDFNKNNDKYFTHTTDKNGFWNRKIDYLFTNRSFLNGRVIQDTMKLSDHAPIVVDFYISKQK